LARSAVIEILIIPSSDTWCTTFDSCGRPFRRMVVRTDWRVVRAKSTALLSSMPSTNGWRPPAVPSSRAAASPAAGGRSIASERVASPTPSGPTFARFSGFADLYDANRPSPPDGLGRLLCDYVTATAPHVVDLGSGSGLSSRWAASWAASVTGIEPNDDMRSVAEGRPVAGITYRAGTGHDTGLPDRRADIVIAVQSLHWMEPVSTLAEVDRILRPGGAFAAIDADWPPVSGVTGAEAAWVELHRRIRVFEARAARNETGELLRRPVDDDDPALADDDLGDPHLNRALPGGTRSWSKRAHLDRMAASGHFAFTRELLFQQATSGGGAERFVALMRSQGSYQGLLRIGLNDLDLGVDVFEHDVHASFAGTRGNRDLSFSWRVRLGVKPAGPPRRRGRR
jgi:SAM-dependent methyltransferase